MENLTIEYETFYRAFTGTSFSPEARAKSYQKDYIQSINNIKEELKNKNIPEETTTSLLLKFKSLYQNWLFAKSSCISSMIAGPSNFPVTRAEKANRREETASEKIRDFQDRIISKVIRKYNPDPNIIRSDDNNAIERLKAKLSKLEADREKMKLTNKAFKKYLKTQDETELLKLGYTSEQIKQLVKIDSESYSWNKGRVYPSYASTNLSGRIRATKQRIIHLEREKETPSIEQEVCGIRIVENKELMRIQLFFEKDNLTVRKLVKSNGFRWSPRAKAWQRHLNNNTRFIIKYMLKKLKEEA